MRVKLSKDKLKEINDLLKTGLSLSSVCKKIKISECTLRKLKVHYPELNEIINNTRHLRNKSMPEKTGFITLKQNFKVIENNPEMALSKFKIEYQERKKQIMLKNLKDPYY